MISPQLGSSRIGINVNCSGATYPIMFRIWVSLLIGKFVWYVVRNSQHFQVVLPRREYAERSSATHVASTHLHLLCR